MSNRPHRMDLDEPPGAGWEDDPDRKRGKPGPREIFVLPDQPVEAFDDDDERDALTKREKAVAVARLKGASFLDIAQKFDLGSAAEAKRIFDRAIAATHPVEDLETMRRTAIARAEMLLSQSLAMATADFLVNKDTGERVQNSEKLKWHQQAQSDLMAHAAIAGTKAPAKMELSAADVEIDKIVTLLMQKTGPEMAIEAEVLELEVIPDLVERAEEE